MAKFSNDVGGYLKLRLEVKRLYIFCCVEGTIQQTFKPKSKIVREFQENSERNLREP